jgi:serine acetyltransferase
LKLIEVLNVDYNQLTSKKANILRIVFTFFTSTGFRAIVLYRVRHKFHNRGNRLLSASIRSLIFHWCQCEIGMGAKIGAGFCIRHTGAIVIGGRTEIG